MNAVSWGKQAKESKETKDYDDLFDEDDNQFLDEEATESRSPAKKSAVGEDEDDDDDDLMPATGRPRHRSSFLDDDNSQGVRSSPRRHFQRVKSTLLVAV